MSQTSSLSEYKSFFLQNKNEALNDFSTFLRFPSISSEPSYRDEVHQCANWVENYLQNVGLKTEKWETSGHPVIFGECLDAGPSQPTLLLYNHYDVQPVDPLELWKTDPFDPQIIDGEIYARGAQDNKGQCFYTMLALKALKKKTGKFPINIKIIIEGEEEFGSKGLTGILKKYEKRLSADYLAVVDVGIPDRKTPAVTLGVRGLIGFQIIVKGSTTDLHSGSHGGIVYNPNHALAEILSKLRNPDGSIAVPGFYDEVQEIPKEVLNHLYLEFNEEKYLQDFGAKTTGGEKKYPPSYRVSLRPTLEVNGMWGGYIGEGFKTVIPAEAGAKITCRLVPNMDPIKTGQRVIDFIKSIAPPGISVEATIFHGGKAVRANPKSKIVSALKESYEEVFEKPCCFVFEGGSIPITTALAETSKSEIVLFGVGLPDDRIHAPNEHFGIDRLEQGFLIVVRAIEKLSSK